MAAAWQWHQEAEGVEATWREAADGASVFQSYAFARHWLAVFGEGRAVRILVHRDPPLIIPAVIADRELTLIGQGLFDYLDLIGEADEERLREAAALWRANGEWDRIHVAGVPVDSRFGTFWEALGGRPLGEEEAFCQAPQRAAGNAAAFARQHPRSAGRWRKALAAGCALESETDPGRRSELLAWILRHKAQHLAAQGQANVLGEAERRWLERMIGAEPGLAELWTLRRGPDRLSALLCWRSPSTRYAYTICYDWRERALSPGILLLYGLIHRSLEEGRGFDFLTGEQAFKQRFASHAVSLLRLRCRRG